MLAVVICAIALSLAYPVREYIAQRRQIDQLQAQNAQMLTGQLQRLQHEQAAAERPRLHRAAGQGQAAHVPARCQTCYVVIGGQHGHRSAAVPPRRA